jgi:hypothetical protein
LPSVNLTSGAMTSFGRESEKRWPSSIN